MILLREKGAAAAALFLASACAAQTSVPRVTLAPEPVLTVAGAFPAATGAPPLAHLPEFPPAPADIGAALPPAVDGPAPLAAPAPIAEETGPVSRPASGPQREIQPGESPEESRARIELFWESASPLPHGPDEVQSALDSLVKGTASPEFIGHVRGHMARTIPAPILRELVKAGYRIEINTRIREGREDLDPENDLVGGFHSYGPKGKFIIIAEFYKLADGSKWASNMTWQNGWQNGIDHEIGHAIAYLMGERAAAKAEAAGEADFPGWYRTKGMSESPEFYAAWKRDYEAIPAELKEPYRPDGGKNYFYYFLAPDKAPDTVGWYQRARQETFAEGFDILLRGKDSLANYDNFRRYFPRSMEVLRLTLEHEYGLVFPPR